MYCAHCSRPFDSGPPEYRKEDHVRGITFPFCSEACMRSYG